MGFSRQEYWSGLLFPSPGNFLTQGSNPGLLHCRQNFYQLSHKGSPKGLGSHRKKYILLWQGMKDLENILQLRLADVLHVKLDVIVIKNDDKYLALQFTLNIAWDNFFHILDKEAEANK